MIVVAIIGILASVAIPAFDKYIRKSKTSEAKTFVKKLYDGARAYYMEPNYGTKTLTPVAPQFPGIFGASGGHNGAAATRIGFSTGQAIQYGAANSCCAVSNFPNATEKCEPRSSLWDHPVNRIYKQALQFSVEDPAYYAYSYARLSNPGVTGQPAGLTDGFMASAMGDLDCDGTRSEFAMFGWATPDGVGGTSTISKWNELE